MTTLAIRVANRMADLQLSEEAVAKLTHGALSQVSVHKIKTGKAKSTRSLVALASALRCSPTWLQTGERDCVNDITKEYNPPNTDKTTLTAVSITGKIPVISWTTAGDWHDIMGSLQDYEADEWIPAIGSHSAQTFALRIRGDSMEPTIPNGSTIVVDPAIPADNNRVVVIMQNGDTEATCKRLIIEGGKRYLKPDNPRYPILEMLPDAVICGVAVKIVADL